MFEYWKILRKIILIELIEKRIQLSCFFSGFRIFLQNNYNDQDYLSVIIFSVKKFTIIKFVWVWEECEWRWIPTLSKNKIETWNNGHSPSLHPRLSKWSQLSKTKQIFKINWGKLEKIQFIISDKYMDRPG